MADHIVEVDRGGSGMGAGLVIGILAILLFAIIAFFLMFGGPNRFAGGQTNVNAPAQSQPQAPPQTAPNINVPGQIDVNVNQRPAPAAQ